MSTSATIRCVRYVCAVQYRRHWVHRPRACAAYGSERQGPSGRFTQLHHPHPCCLLTPALQTCYQNSPYVFDATLRAELRTKYGLTLQQAAGVAAAFAAGMPGEVAVMAVKAQAAEDAAKPPRNKGLGNA